MKNDYVNRTPSEDSRSLTKIVYGIVGLWFVAAFTGGMMDIFYQPECRP